MKLYRNKGIWFFHSGSKIYYSDCIFQLFSLISKKEELKK